MTVAHLRTYTIKPGKLDSWLKFLIEEGQPIMEECGMKIEGVWVNREQNQCIWIRSYGDTVETVEECEEAFANHSWRKAAGDFLRAHVEHREMVLIESVDGGKP